MGKKPKPEVDDPRFDVSLRSEDTPNLFRDVDHADDLRTAIRLAREHQDRTGRDAFVWDRKSCSVAWPSEGIPQLARIQPLPPPQPTRRRK